MSKVQYHIDMMGREVAINFPPQRIVSLVPSQTEFLINIGAPVVGRTKFCIHPKEKIQSITVIGGTKKLRFDEIRKLHLDLIIGNKEENDQEGIATLEKEFPVWMSDIYTLEDAFHMMRSLGDICGLSKPANTVVEECMIACDQIRGTRSGTVLYLIWQNPWMAAGKNTFIDHLLTHLGYENVLKLDRYPTLTGEEIEKLNPEQIFLSSEPYPFKQAHLEEAKHQWPNADCQWVDGERYSWYGSRLKNWADAK